MIDRRISGLSSVHTVLLAVEAALSWFVIATVYSALPGKTFTTLLPFAAYPIAIVVGIVMAMWAFGRGDSNLMTLGWTEAMGLAFRQTVSVTGAVFTVAVGFKDPGISRVFLAVFLASEGLLLLLVNRYQPGLLVRLLFAGGSRLPTLVLGDDSLFPDLDQWLVHRQKLGLMPVGLIQYRGQVPRIGGLPVVGEFEDLEAAITRTEARQVLMLSLPQNSDDAEHLARICARCGCRLLIHNNLTFRLTYPLRVLTQDAYSFLGFQDEPLEDPLNRGLKRALDIAVSLPVVVLVLPPLVAIVWMIQRRQAPGSLMYRQPRVGRAGRCFNILKFRTMYANAEGELRQTAPADVRIFRFGRFLRKTSIDELPQFFNVLMGDMSVVGPRPHFIRHDEEFAGAINEYRIRYFVKPGITGLAQSRGLRGAISNSEGVRQRIQLDLVYIHNWSIWLDMSIIARTVQQLVRPPPMAH